MGLATIPPEWRRWFYKCVAAHLDLSAHSSKAVDYVVRTNQQWRAGQTPPANDPSEHSPWGFCSDLGRPWAPREPDYHRIWSTHIGGFRGWSALAWVEGSSTLRDFHRCGLFEQLLLARCKSHAGPIEALRNHRHNLSL